MAIIIDQKWLDKNRQDPTNLGTSALDYLDTSLGAFQNLRLWDKTLDVIKEVNGPLSPTLSSFKGTLGTGMSVFAIPALPGDTVDAVKSVIDLRKNNGVSFSRKCMKALQNVASAISTYIDCIGFFLPLSVKSLTRGLGFTYAATGLQMTVVDYTKAAALESKATGEAKVAVQHTKTHLFLKLIKSIASTAASILGIAALVVGYLLLPPFAMLAISVTTLFFGIAADLYKPMGRYPVIKFDKEVKLA